MFAASEMLAFSIVLDVSVLLSEQPDVRRTSVVRNRMMRCR